MASRESTPPEPPVCRGVDTESSRRLSVAAVARRLGVAPATLRTWDRRYGIGPSGHTDRAGTAATRRPTSPGSS